MTSQIRSGGRIQPHAAQLHRPGRLHLPWKTGKACLQSALTRAVHVQASMTSRQVKLMSPSKSVHPVEIKIKLSQQKQLRLVWNEINKKSEGTVVAQRGISQYLWLLGHQTDFI